VRGQKPRKIEPSATLEVLDRPPRFRHVFFVLAVSAVLMNSIDSKIAAVAVPQLTMALTALLILVGRDDYRLPVDASDHAAAGGQAERLVRQAGDDPD
jgi:hypothetical protein